MGKNDVIQYLEKVSDIPDGQFVRIIKSPYRSLLEEAREITGRDTAGKIIDSKKTGDWLGAIAYLIAVDHIGGKFSVADETRQIKIGNLEKKLNGKKCDFISALVYFSDVTDEEILALYALRCSLMHEYALQNKTGNDNLNYSFSVTRGDGDLCVFEEGGGKVKNAKINLEQVGTLVEKIHQKLLSYNEQDLLQVNSELTRITFLKTK
jgi:hypothetical protein